MKYGLSYFGCRYPQHFKKDLDELKKKGFQKVLITYSENDYFFYSKTIKLLNQIAKENGFETYLNPWGVLGIFGGEAFSKFLLDNIDIWQKNNLGEIVPHACLTNPKTLELLMKWLNSALEIQSDYIFWDEPHFILKIFKKIQVFGDVVVIFVNQSLNKYMDIIFQKK